MGATSQTVTYSGAVALALDKLHPQIADAVSSGNKGLFFLKRKGNFKPIQSGGAQFRVPVMFQLQSVRPVGSYGSVNINPVQSDTAAIFSYGQIFAHVTFSDMEEFQTRGQESLQSIVEAKRREAEAAINDGFSKAFFLGQAAVDATSLASPLLGEASATFVDPIGKLVHFAPTSSVTVGGIDQSANSWWQNQYSDVNATTTLAAWLHQLRALHTKCGFGGGGQDAYPDAHFLEPTTYDLYQKALALTQRTPDYKMGDIPFENVAFKGAPAMPEEFVGDIKSAAYPAVTYGTWYMWNSAFAGFRYAPESFRVGKSIRPANQPVESALMPVRGALYISNRRKFGVMGGITLATLGSATS